MRYFMTLLVGIAGLLSFLVVQAAELTLTPSVPIVEINKTVALSVQGAVGTVKWVVGEGKIQGDGPQVIYLAPAQAGLDVVTVLDSEGNLATVKVVVTPPSDFSMENAQWEIFTNRSYIQALLLSDDGKTLWVGTNGGLEKRDAQTGEIQQIFLNTDGLPNNNIQALLSDGQGGLWIGTNEGLAHYTAQGQWQTFNEVNSDLPDNYVRSLLNDGQGGLWVGTGGLARYTAQGQWQTFNMDNSELPDNNVRSLLSDGQGGLWVGTYEGLAHYTAQGEWQTFNTDNSSLPHNWVGSLLSDGQSGLWVGTTEGGLARYTTQGQWQTFNTENSGLPDNWIYSLLSDSQGGLWVGTGEGLARYTAQREWQTFHTDNSGLPDNDVISLLSDGQGGLWVGTLEGLAHYTAQGEWQTFNTDNSGLPDNFVWSLLSDGQGELWVGTYEGGLARYTAQGEWQTFNTDNSGLPDNWVYSLLSDGQGGLWVGTYEGGLARYTAQGEWLNPGNSGLPSSYVQSLLSDGQGGLWVGTGLGGLARYTAQGEWQTFNTENSGLPYNWVNSLLSDGQGGLWIGTSAGLAHLTFGRQTELCTQAEIDAATCQAIQQGQHAAIIVAAGGAQQSDPLWDNTEAITTRIYRTFYRRGFDKSSLYYLSPKTWADFDGDGRNDRINRLTEDRNLTLADLKNAFAWAKTKGKFDQPLYFFFMDHGGEGKLKLSDDTNITAEELKTVLDDYQNTTGNQLIVVIEACHSGSLVPVLTAPNRAVIASAKDSEYAYFFEKKGFSRFFADYLLKGANFWESFQLASRDQEKLLGKNTDLQTAGDTGLTSQTPQTDDNQDGLFTTDDGKWLKQVYVNGQFTTADATLAVENQTPATALTVDQPVTLQAKVTLTQGTVQRVWAVIRPPAMAKILDTNGTPILAFPRLNLGQSRDNPEIWQATWQNAVYNGNYLITFYAEDNEKNIASSEQDTVLTVSGGIDPPSQAQVQIHLEKTSYQRGESFKATLTEDLGWGYDLYAAVLFPDGQNFMTLKNTNELRPLLNEAKPWYAQRKQGSTITLFDLTLPADLPTGQYCLYGILSPEQNDVFETLGKGLWVMDTKCFEVE